MADANVSSRRRNSNGYIAQPPHDRSGSGRSTRRSACSGHTGRVSRRSPVTLFRLLRTTDLLSVRTSVWSRSGSAGARQSRQILTGLACVRACRRERRPGERRLGPERRHTVHLSRAAARDTNQKWPGRLAQRSARPGRPGRFFFLKKQSASRAGASTRRWPEPQTIWAVFTDAAQRQMAAARVSNVVGNLASGFFQPFRLERPPTSAEPASARRRSWAPGNGRLNPTTAPVG